MTAVELPPEFRAPRAAPAVRSATERAADGFRVLQRASALFAEELRLDVLLRELSALVASAVQASYVRIWLAAESEATLRVRWCRGVATMPETLVRASIGEGIVGAVLLRRTTVHVKDPEDPRLRDGDPDAEGAALACPMLDHLHRVVGVIEVRGPLLRPFDAIDEELLGVVARHTAIGWSRAELFGRLEEWAKSLEMLLAFNAAVNKHLDPREVVRALVEHAARFLNACGGRAGVAVPTATLAGELMMSSDGRFLHGQWADERTTWTRGEGIPGTLLESEFPLLANEPEPAMLADPALAAAGVTRILAVPIKTGALQLVGFFELYRQPSAPPFTWQDAAFVESLGNTTAVAIENARLLRALEGSRDEVRALSADHVLRLEQERRQIARELHDVAGQALIGIKLGLQAVTARVAQEAPSCRSELDALRAAVNDSTLQLKTLARTLRPPTLDTLGLGAALRQLGADVEGRTGLMIRLKGVLDLPRLSQETEIALYRIVQEALTNVARHAGACEVWISLEHDAQTLRVEITDTGCGFDLEQIAPGMGRLGMHERATLLGGTLTVHSSVGGGTRVEARVPVH
ncbi:MAG: GAF domain-containing sensor histidine kinase [Gemmatimonadaceae bacterium]|nr:GAF domain-containing sensor histidine kinase [Gemmatimonadaceae bacterium]